MNTEGLRELMLDQVITVSEVCGIWGVTQKTVMMAIFKGKIVGRQADYGKIWLVHRGSCRKHWGDPRKDGQS